MTSPLKSLFTKNGLGHPVILISLGVVALIAVGGGIYYAVATEQPSLLWAMAENAPIQEVVTGTGSVEAAQNPNLAFQSGGRVADVAVSVGQSVSSGQLLASLDTASLQASLAGAQANLAGAKAKLDEMQAGPRNTDVITQQTAVAAAQQTLANLYANVPANVANAYQTTYAAIRSDSDTLFNNPDSQNPTLLFQTTDSQDGASALTARSAVNAALITWQSSISALSTSEATTSSDASLDQALTNALVQLRLVQAYDGYVLSALASSIPSTSFSQTQLTAAQASVGALSSTVNGLILSLQQGQEQIASANLAVQSAQDGLSQILAGSTPQDIEVQEATVAAAQAAVESAQATLSDAVVVAPFSGTVSSVAVKEGQIVTSNTLAVSLTPESALQVTIGVSEVDVAKVSAGQSAQVTLDAYGTSRIFSATVVSVDTSPTTQADGTQGYTVTLQFTKNDPAIATGMNANVTILAAQDASAIVVPLSAIIQSGDEAFVLTPSSTPGGTTEQPVTLGLESTSSVEILSGLSIGDKYLVSAQ